MTECVHQGQTQLLKGKQDQHYYLQVLTTLTQRTSKNKTAIANVFFS